MSNCSFSSITFFHLLDDLLSACALKNARVCSRAPSRKSDVWKKARDVHNKWLRARNAQKICRRKMARMYARMRKRQCEHARISLAVAQWAPYSDAALLCRHTLDVHEIADTNTQESARTNICPPQQSGADFFLKRLGNLLMFFFHLNDRRFVTLSHARKMKIKMKQKCHCRY